jgi:hypothetical protein
MIILAKKYMVSTFQKDRLINKSTNFCPIGVMITLFKEIDDLCQKLEMGDRTRANDSPISQ